MSNKGAVEPLNRYIVRTPRGSWVQMPSMIMSKSTSMNPTRVPLHMFYDIVTKRAAFDLRRALHEAGEIVGDAFAGDGAVQAFQD